MSFRCSTLSPAVSLVFQTCGARYVEIHRTLRSGYGIRRGSHGVISKCRPRITPITARTLLQKGSGDATLSCRQRRLQCTWHSRVRSPPTMLISIAKSKSVENVVGEPPCHLAAPPKSDIASEPREAHQVDIKRAGGSEVATQSLQRGPRHHLSTPRLYRAMSDPTMRLISA